MSRAEAIKQLGKEDDYINLKGFNTERDIAQDTYNNDYNELQNKFNELLATADRNKATAKTDFNVNRNTLNNNSYMATRGKTGADLSSRGLSKGFGSGGKFVSNLQRNNASSTLANTYYDAMADIQRDIDKGTQDHNYNMEKLKLDLDRTVASINAREAEKRNAYRTAVAQLAEQIQARYDANYYAQKQLENAKKQYEDTRNMEIYSAISTILGNDPSKINLNLINQAKKYYENITGNNGYKDALNYLYEKGFLNDDIYLPLVSTKVPSNISTKTNTSSKKTNTSSKPSGTIPTNKNSYSKPSGIIPSSFDDLRR